jgi:hypothetical protein
LGKGDVSGRLPLLLFISPHFLDFCCFDKFDGGFNKFSRILGVVLSEFDSVRPIIIHRRCRL